MSRNVLFGLCCVALLALAGGCASSEDVCKDITCSGHGTCADVNGQATCNCETGYYADGLECKPTPADCTGQTCSGHGTCVVEAGFAKCNCDPTFINQGPLACVPEGGCFQLGVTCTQPTECCTGYCLKYVGQETGFCSKNDCKSNSECTNVSGDGKTMCCVDVGGDSFICLKGGKGCSCGDQSGTCGSSCACQMSSACDPNFPCLSSGDDDPNAVCSAKCHSDNDCANCQDPNDPDKVFTCQPISGGETYCLAGQALCQSSADCEDPEVCVPFPSADGKKMEPGCSKLGDLPPGSVCDDDANANNLPASERCSDFYCLNDHCSEVCEMSSDCPEHMVCNTINFCMDSGCSTIAAIGMCYWMEGPLTACDGNGDCPAGSYCGYYLPPGSASTVQKVCVNQNCDPANVNTCMPLGSDCYQVTDKECFGDFCIGSGEDYFCSALCKDDTDCPSNMLCGLLRVSDTQTTGACIPGRCAGNSDCKPDEVCMPTVGPNNTIIGACESTSGTIEFGGACNDSANPDPCKGFCFDGHCSSMCDTDADCGAGGVCSQIGFCLDSYCNEIGYGAVCRWFPGSGNPCGAHDDCPAGEMCNFYTNPTGTEVVKICTTQNCDPSVPEQCAPAGGECGTGKPPCFGDLCLTGGYCSTLCDVNADCPQGMICGAIGLSETLSIGGCIKFEGSGEACGSNADCADNNPAEVCEFVGTVNGIETLCATPTANGANPGETCNQTVLCANDLCLTAGYCSAVCQTNADCAAYTMECTYIGLSQTEYGTACVQPDADSPLCSICATDADCGAAKCIESAVVAGEKYCGKVCTQGGNECPSGTTCTDLGGGTWNCKPNADTCRP
jgi:hypothetical protein